MVPFFKFCSLAESCGGYKVLIYRCSISNLSYQGLKSEQMLPGLANTAKWERLVSTTKCCIPARKFGKSENSPEASSVIVGIEVDDAETIEKPQWDGTGPVFVWINTFWDYMVCQNTATWICYFKHQDCLCLKLDWNEKKEWGVGRKPKLASTCWKCWP